MAICIRACGHMHIRIRARTGGGGRQRAVARARAVVALSRTVFDTWEFDSAVAQLTRTGSTMPVQYYTNELIPANPREFAVDPTGDVPMLQAPIQIPLAEPEKVHEPVWVRARCRHCADALAAAGGGKTGADAHVHHRVDGGALLVRALCVRPRVTRDTRVHRRYSGAFRSCNQWRGLRARRRLLPRRRNSPQATWGSVADSTVASTRASLWRSRGSQTGVRRSKWASQRTPGARPLRASLAGRTWGCPRRRTAAVAAACGTHTAARRPLGTARRRPFGTARRPSRTERPRTRRRRTGRRPRAGTTPRCCRRRRSTRTRTSAVAAATGGSGAASASGRGLGLVNDGTETGTGIGIGTGTAGTETEIGTGSGTVAVTRGRRGGMRVRHPSATSPPRISFARSTILRRVASAATTAGLFTIPSTFPVPKTSPRQKAANVSCPRRCARHVCRRACVWAEGRPAWHGCGDGLLRVREGVCVRVLGVCITVVCHVV